MKYQGSKSRIAKEIIPIITKDRQHGQYYVEPFCGSASVIQEVDNPRIAADNNYYLIELLRSIQNGWIPPNNITEENYKCVKNNPDDYSAALVGFVGFCCSFSGKFWGGYARGNDNKGRPRNYCDEQKRNLFKQAPKLAGIDFRCCDYKKLKIPPNSIIYCIPEEEKVYINGLYEPIKEIKINDDLGNNNYVKNIFIRDSYNEKILKIKVMGLNTIFCIQSSNDHKFFTYDKENSKIIIKKAEELKIKDYLLIEINDSVDNYIPDMYFITNKKQRICKQNFISFNKEKHIELSKLIGYYAAEGHSQNGIIFSFNHEEEEYLRDVSNLSKEVFGIEGKICRNSPHETVSQVRIFSRDIEAYFKNFITGNAIDKRLNNLVMLWEPKIQLELLKSWLKGDGGVQIIKTLNTKNRKFIRSNNRNKFKITGTTASLILAQQMYQISLRCRLHPCIKKRENNYDVYFSCKSDYETIMETKIISRDCKRRKWIDNFLITPITEIESKEYTGKMYDIETKDGYFNLFGGVKVHNCDPPYYQTTKYKTSTNFNYPEFYDWCRKKHDDGHQIFISEYQMPPDFNCVWQKEIYSSLDLKGGKRNMERLFTL